MYRKRRDNKDDRWPGLFEALAEIIIAAMFLLGKLLYKFIRWIVRDRNKKSYIFREFIPNSPLHESETATPLVSRSTNEPVVTTEVDNRATTSPFSRSINEALVETAVNKDSKYILKQSLLTDAEKKFLKTLEPIIGDKYRIECQVLLSGIVKVTDSSERYINYHDFNVIKSKSIDFVLYDVDYKPYLAIELDDRSHSRWDRIKRDQIVNEIMNSVGLRIIHIPVSYQYDTEKLRNEILGVSF